MNTTYAKPLPILVLGATGKTGRRIAQGLTARGMPVRAGSRANAPPFHWEDETTWAPVLEGTSAVYISFYPDLAVPGAPEKIAAFVAQALACGTRRLVLLSGRGESEAQRAEQVLRDSNAGWTILRCSWFMQNFSESLFLPPLLAGRLALPVGQVPEPFVDADDIAEVAVAALLDARHIGQLYELTGPRLLTFAAAVAEIARASGQALNYETIPMDAFADESLRQGVAADVVDFLGYLFTEVLDGRNAFLGDGVRKALGRDPRDFADFCRASATSGVWSTP